MERILYCFISLLITTTTLNAQFQFISPRPGSKYHNPECTIILRDGSLIDSTSLAEGNLFNLTGSKSGNHDFIITLSDDSRTIILKPCKPFSEAEVVTIVVKDGIKKITGEIVKGLSFNFSIHPSRSAEEENRYAEFHKRLLDAEFGKNEEGDDFLSDGRTDNFDPFNINVNTAPAPGNIFYHNIALLGPPLEGPSIITSEGEVMFKKIAPSVGLNFTLNQNKYITMFDEVNDHFLMMDSSFYVIDQFKAGNGYETDIHDFLVFPGNHSFMIGLDFQTIDMTVYDSSYQANATVIGAIVQELDASKNVIFEWRSWDHVGITEALHEPLWFGYIDYVHANSIEIDYDENILLSCRNLDQVIKINRGTGNVMWRLGGIKNDFTFVNDSMQFNYQHDARRISNGDITLFDNGNFHPVPQSYAREYQLDEVNKTATLVWSYSHPYIGNNPVIGYSMGNAQRLDNGNTLINWGGIYNGTLGQGSPNITEVDKQDSIVWEMTLEDKHRNVIYRAHRFEWDPCARPSAKPMKTVGIKRYAALLSWLPATGAVGYKLEYRKFGSPGWQSVLVKNTAEKLTNLEPSTHYLWRIQTICDSVSSKTSAYSEVKEFTTLPEKAILETENLSDMDVFPNPAHQTMKVQFYGDNFAPVKLSLYDLLNQEVIRRDIADTGITIEISVEKIPTGIYMLIAETRSGYCVKKVIVQ